MLRILHFRIRDVEFQQLFPIGFVGLGLSCQDSAIAPAPASCAGDAHASTGEIEYFTISYRWHTDAYRFVCNRALPKMDG